MNMSISVLSDIKELQTLLDGGFLVCRQSHASPVFISQYDVIFVRTRGKAISGQLRVYLRKNYVMLTLYFRVTSGLTYLIENKW